VLSRRAFLAGTAGAAGAVVLAACGSDGDDGDGDARATTTSARPTTTSTTVPITGMVAVGLLTSQLLTGRQERVAFALLHDNAPLGEGVAVEVAFGPDADHLGPRQPAALHDDGVPTPYFLTSTTVDRPGRSVMEVRVNGAVAQVSPLTFVDPATSRIPVPGEKLVSVPTPTPRDPRGVDPICTRKPPCPLHDVSLDDALAGGQAIALLFGTPALCQTRLCGPVLDVLLGEQATFADRIQTVHAEVYTNLEDFRLTEAMRAFHLTIDPILFLAGPGGVIEERLEGIYDRKELKDALTRLVG
jgi:hypothetical protein